MAEGICVYSALEAGADVEFGDWVTIKRHIR